MTNEKNEEIRLIITNLNKRAVSQATGISYNKLRKYSSQAVEQLSADELQKIYEYLISIALPFQQI